MRGVHIRFNDFEEIGILRFFFFFFSEYKRTYSRVGRMFNLWIGQFFVVIVFSGFLFSHLVLGVRVNFILLRGIFGLISEPLGYLCIIFFFFERLYVKFFERFLVLVWSIIEI